MLTDNSRMSFGKYKGKRLGDIPDSYFLFMYDRKKLTAELKAYAEERVPILRYLAEKRKKKKPEG